MCSPTFGVSGHGLMVYRALPHGLPGMASMVLPGSATLGTPPVMPYRGVVCAGTCPVANSAMGSNRGVRNSQTVLEVNLEPTI